LVEVDGARVEAQRDGGCLDRRGAMAVVLRGERIESDLVSTADLPEELGIDLLGEPLRLGHESPERLSVEAQEHVRGLDLRALAVRGLDLERRAGLREDRPYAECAVFLEENLLHALSAQSTSSGTCSGKEASV